VTLPNATSGRPSSKNNLDPERSQGRTAILKVVKASETPDHHRHPHRPAPQPDDDAPHRRPERVDKIGAAIAAADPRQSRFSKRATLRP